MAERDILCLQWNAPDPPAVVLVLSSCLLQRSQLALDGICEIPSG